MNHIKNFRLFNNTLSVKKTNEEIAISTILGGLSIAAVVKKVYDEYKNWTAKRGLKETGRTAESLDGIIFREYTYRGKDYYGVTFEDETRDDGYTNPRVLLFNIDSPEGRMKLQEILRDKIIWSQSDESRMDDDYDRKLGQFVADEVVYL